ncbi:hypothetical protein BRW65_21440 [Mycobacterium paraffinicum]|uniref:Lipoprotein LppO n=1 Tax=Mycobacterium paraffinicum TaxID=53378 RepID=A0A1Q4HPS6_9MYCO|nr:lipoprotein LpqH [Mycobacterium paraffinicum]OJZ69905.1 hypothetical protein BRW65_21440 [Mycobacterium paraffinicum]
MTNRYILTAAGVVLATGLSGCSGKDNHPASTPSSTPVAVTTTVMIDGNKHTMTARVECSSSAAQPNASPPESGDLTTRIGVHDDTASVSLAVSDENPPMIDGFALSLTLATGQYQLPYQATKSANQVQATKQGKSYTITGAGEASTPGQSGTRPVTFGVHVTCP